MENCCSEGVSTAELVRLGTLRWPFVAFIFALSNLQGDVCFGCWKNYLFNDTNVWQFANWKNWAVMILHLRQVLKRLNLNSTLGTPFSDSITFFKWYHSLSSRSHSFITSFSGPFLTVFLHPSSFCSSFRISNLQVPVIYREVCEEEAKRRVRNFQTDMLSPIL